MCGLGKSFQIKKDFEKEFKNLKNYVYFPLGGDITSKELLKRLLKLGNKKEILLHIR